MVEGHVPQGVGVQVPPSAPQYLPVLFATTAIFSGRFAFLPDYSRKILISGAIGCKC